MPTSTPPRRSAATPDVARRRWLAGAAGGAAGLVLPGAQLGWAAPVAGAPDRGRLVVVLLRGALDGLAAVPAPGDPDWAALRPPQEGDLARHGAPLPLPGTPGGAPDGHFALHPQLTTLAQWFQAQELLILHATASAYRERSHFDAQQMLESGGSRPFELATGWLGRALQTSGQAGLALGPSLPLALRGADRASSWSPDGRAAPPSEEFLDRVARLYAQDPTLANLLAQARAQHAEPPAPRSRSSSVSDANQMGSREPGSTGPLPAPADAFTTMAGHAGRLLAAPDGPAVAWLDSAGWDTHTQQAPRLARLLASLDQGLATLRSALGGRWADTSVLVMTEFGRSARLNGSGGSDHGTASVAFLAGGAVAGGRVLGEWPGLAAAQLHQQRDLRPTTDLRALIGPVLQRHLGLSAAQLGAAVLPGAPTGLTGLWRG